MAPAAGESGPQGTEPLSAATRRRITALIAVQEKHRKLEHDLKKEMFALEKKYLKMYQPYFERRFKIVSGLEDPVEDEVADGKKVEEEDRRRAEETAGKTDMTVTELKDDEEEKEDAKKDQGVPEFWLTAMKNHLRLSELITLRDEVPLRALKDIELSYLPDETPGYRLVFKFDENETFTNRELVKTYYYKPEPEDGDLMYERAEGTKIDWKDDQDLTVTVETKRQRHKATNQVRLVKKTVPAETFFNFFQPPRVPAEGSKEESEITDDDREELAAHLDLDYELGEEFKERIIPKAVDWFTGKALEFEDFEPAYGDEDDCFDDDEDDEDEEDDDEENDDEDNVDDEEGKDASKVPPECKQQ